MAEGPLATAVVVGNNDVDVNVPEKDVEIPSAGAELVDDELALNEIEGISPNLGTESRLGLYLVRS